MLCGLNDKASVSLIKSAGLIILAMCEIVYISFVVVWFAVVR